MRKQLTYIEPRRLGVVLGIIYGLLGLVCLPLSLIITAIGRKAGGSPTTFNSSVFVWLLPVGYAGAGLIAGIIIATIYNLIAKRLGGIEFELRDLPTAGHFPPQDSVVEEPLDSHTLIIGNWFGKAANNFVGVYTFYADGNVQCDASGPGGSHRVSGQWEVDGDSILAKWDNGDTDIIKLISPRQYRWTNAQSPDAGGTATRQ